MQTREFQFDTRLSVTTDKTEDDLRLIHQYADASTTLDDFAIVEMRAIDDRPLIWSGERLIVSPEWLSANIAKFQGVPFVKDHDSKSPAKLGRVYAAEMRDDEDGSHAVYMKAFIGKGIGNDEDIERIRKGRDLEVSVGFRVSEFEETKINGVPHLRIMPSDSPTDGPYEISSVGVPAVRGARITRIAASADGDDGDRLPEAREIELHSILKDGRLCESDRECLLFGRQSKAALIDDVVSYERRLGFVKDVQLAAQGYQSQSPYALQDRRDSLLKLVKGGEQQTTQCSVDFSALTEDVMRDYEESATTLTAREIARRMKEGK